MVKKMIQAIKRHEQKAALRTMIESASGGARDDLRMLAKAYGIK